MRFFRHSFAVVFLTAAVSVASAAIPKSGHEPPSATVDRIFTEALSNGQGYAHLRDLTTRYPGRLSGSAVLEGAVRWAQAILGEMKLDRVYLQDVTVPHWERGAPESVMLLTAAGTQPLAALALGGSPATADNGIAAEVIEVTSIEALERLGAAAAGKIVFFNRPADPTLFRTENAYVEAVDQRSRGPTVAARFGAVAALVRSITLATDDIPHTGNTTFDPAVPAIPAAALGIRSANLLAAALAAHPHTQVSVQIHSRWLAAAISHNVIGEIRGSEHPDEIILVGGHLDSWDNTPGAHDDGAGVVQAIEVLRLFRTLHLKPRHTIRCVLFTNEENGQAGSAKYAELARTGGRHLFALESDNGGFAPAGFNLGSTQGAPHERAQRWRPLFEPWGVWSFVKGTGGVDVGPLMLQGITVAGLRPDSQRYFDYHHTAADTIDQVNPRELHLGAAAIAALIWLVDTEGL